MTDHELDMLQQAATRLSAEYWHNTAFVYDLQAHAATTDYDRFWLGRDAKESGRYATWLDSEAERLAADNDAADNLELQEWVDDARWTATHNSIPSTDTPWDPPIPPLVPDPPLPQFSISTGDAADTDTDIVGAVARSGDAVRDAHRAVRRLREVSADETGHASTRAQQLALWHAADQADDVAEHERSTDRDAGLER